jgi:hypothetical protein
MHTVEVHFLDGFSSVNTIKIPTMILVSCAFGLGFFMAWFFELLAHFKLKSQLKSQLREKQKHIDKLEGELSKLNQSSDVSLKLKNPSLSNT